MGGGGGGGGVLARLPVIELLLKLHSGSAFTSETIFANTDLLCSETGLHQKGRLQ